MSDTQPVQDQDPVHAKIKLRAHEIWVREGCPSGHDLDHWLQAESEIAAEAASETGHPPARKKMKCSSPPRS